MFSVQVLKGHVPYRPPRHLSDRHRISGAARDLLGFCLRRLFQHRVMRMRTGCRFARTRCRGAGRWCWLPRNPVFPSGRRFPFPPDPRGPARGLGFGAAGREPASPLPRARAEAVPLRAGPQGARHGRAAGGGGRRDHGRGECEAGGRGVATAARAGASGASPSDIFSLVSAPAPWLRRAARS